jgi:hypothetical protein
MKSLTNPGAAEQRRFDLFAAIALAAIAIILYLPALGADFVYDARLTVLGNDYAHDLRHLWDVLTLRVMHLDVMDNNRPIHLAATMLNWAVWGANPMGHHLFNIVLHAVAAALLFKFCRALLPGASPWVCFAAALLFTVHPLNCESVSEVSYRNDLMVAVCLLGALNLATIFQPDFSRRNVLLGAAIVACMYFAIGSKENAAAGPPLLVCYWLLYRRNERRAPWIALCAAATVVVAGFLIARFTLRPAVSMIFIHDPVRPGDGTLADLATIQPRIWAFYLRQIVWPMDLSPDYGPYSVRNFYPATSMMMVLGVVAVQMFMALQNRAFAIGMALFWFALLPVSNIAPMYRPIADRFLYVPMAGVAIMLAALPWSWARGRAGKIMMALAVTVACVLACYTFNREKVWHDSVALWTDGVKKNPVSAYSPSNLAGSLYDAGRFKESALVYERVVAASHGTDADQLAGMALALDALNRTQEADAAFKKAVKLDKRYAHPDLLLKALIWEKSDVEKLKVIAERNPQLEMAE